MAPEPTTDAGAAREATLADVPALAALMRDFYAEADLELPAAAATRAFAALLAEPALGQVWILEQAAERESEPAGFVVLTVSFSMEYGGLRGFVDDLYVRPASRGRGLAALGLNAVRRGATARGVRALHVEVGPENDAARRLYARSGFADSGHLLLTLPLAAPIHAV